MSELGPPGEERRHALWLARAGSLLCAGWVAGAVWTGSAPHPTSTGRIGTAGSGHALETPIVPAALAIPEPVPDPEERRVEGWFAGSLRKPQPQSPTLPSPRRLALHRPDFRSALGLQLERSFEADLERLTARAARNLESAP